MQIPREASIMVRWQGIQPSAESDLFEDYQLYLRACHPNIVKATSPPTMEYPDWIIYMEHVEGEKLFTTLFQKDTSRIKLSPSIKYTIIRGLCEGLQHLHNQNIVHQDLKPENIMIEYGSHRPVIMDLGCAKFYRVGPAPPATGGNQGYAAPESRLWGETSSKATDVWALGKIIAELLLEGYLNPEDVCPAWIQELIRENPYREEISPYSEVVSDMLDGSPIARTGMYHVISAIRGMPQQRAALPVALPVAAECQNLAYGMAAEAFPRGILSSGRMRCLTLYQSADGTGAFTDIDLSTQENQIREFNRTHYEW